MATSKDKSAATDSTARIVWLRPRVLLILAVLAALGYFGHQAWQQNVPAVRRDPHYAITPERIHVSPQPDWIHTDVRNEVCREGRLAGNLSLLDDGESLQRIKDAFERHPWVASVERITKRLPAGVDVQIEYRRPVAAIETVGQHRAELLAVDQTGMRLPEKDMSEAERRYLPRITRVQERPQVGERWTDPRVEPAVRLAVGLAGVWRSLRLFEIEPQSASVDGSLPIAFSILTSGGTRIVWGSAPGDEPPGESAFATKLKLLQSYAAENGNLGTIYGPEQLDVRSDLRIQPRAARKKTGEVLAEDEEPPAEEVATRSDEDTTKQ